MGIMRKKLFWWLMISVGVLGLVKSGELRLSNELVLGIVLSPMIWWLSEKKEGFEKLIWGVSAMILLIPGMLLIKWRSTATLWIKLVYVILGILTVRRISEEE